MEHPSTYEWQIHSNKCIFLVFKQHGSWTCFCQDSIALFLMTITLSHYMYYHLQQTSGRHHFIETHSSATFPNSLQQPNTQVYSFHTFQPLVEYNTIQNDWIWYCPPSNIHKYRQNIDGAEHLWVTVTTSVQAHTLTLWLQLSTLYDRLGKGATSWLKLHG